jgi:drug/metabolite transporter (DMT)-like permease
MGPRRAFAALKALRPHWLYVLAMGTIGFTLSNSLMFEGARFTTAINISIIQGTMPIFVLTGAWLVYGMRIGVIRGACALITVLGILIVATRGDLFSLAHMKINAGDLTAIGGCALYAVFTLALRYRPAVPAFDFFVGIAMAALVTSLPGMAVEIALGGAVWPSWQGILVLLYVAIFTSLLGQVLFIRAVALVGPGRAGLFQNSVPVIAALMSVVLLGEDFHAYHGLALALVLGGIVASERLGR